MNSVQLLEECLKMLERRGYRPTDISVAGENISISGLELVPPTQAEEAAEAYEDRIRSERSSQALRDLGLD
jgi:hypothetical protein